MDYNITLTANHQSLTAEYLPLVAESVQYLTAKVVCETEDWTGREIKAMFGQGCTVHGVSVTDGEITAKQQLNLTAGDWCVWLVGNSARDGEVIPRITTNVAHISVAPTGGTEGNPFPEIPPTVEEQLRADMGNLADLTTKNKSNLVAAINEAAEGGSKDAVKYTPQTLTDEQQAQARTNIGAEKAGTGYTKPASGIPKSDLAQDVQTSLDKADAAISLGLTAATPGQIIKVKAVQDGKPTEWEAVDLDAGKLTKFTKLLTHTITEDELAASPIAFVWGTAQIRDLNDFNVFVLAIVRPDGGKIEFSKWVRLKINGTALGNICGTKTAASPQYAITANRLFGFWISGAYYNPNNISVPVLVAPRSDLTYQSDLPDSEPVTSIGFTSYGTDYGLTAGIVVEIWGAK